MSRPPRPRVRSARLLRALIALLLVPLAGLAACGAGTSVEERLRDLRLISYYPSAAPWTNMWNRWDAATVDRDFALAAGLGASAVRIIVHPDAFGFPVPAPARTAELAQAMTLAREHGLAVQLTLFDWWDGYQDIAGSDTWAGAVLTPYRDDPRLAFVELKNEIDPGDPAAMAWARHELRTVRSLTGGVPVTVSVAGNEPLDEVRRLKAALGDSQPDFYDIHYYGDPGAARAVFAAARSSVAPYPLFVGETGASSDGAGGYPTQDLYLRTVQWAARSLGLPAPAPWILRDVIKEDVPAGQDTGDLGYGLLTADGREKPAAASVRALFAAGTLDSGFNGDFAGGSSGLPDGWRISDPGTGEVVWDPAGGHDRPGSVVVRHPGTDDSTVAELAVTPVVQPTMPGEVFALAAWAQVAGTVGTGTGTGTGTVAIEWLDQGGLVVGTAASTPLPAGSTGWQLLTVTSAAPAGAAFARVCLRSGGDGGAVRYDDVTFAPSGAPR
jgi:hypothetical protein